MIKKKSNEEFIEDAKKIHGNRYDYSLVKYINCKAPVKIICLLHGIFESRPNNHLNGSNCAKCSRRTKSNEEFIEEAKKIHGNKYDYSLVVYINTRTRIKIICSIHGIFEMQPNSHLQGQNCAKCSKKAKSTEEFITDAKKIHGEKYDYSLVIYINAHTRIKIICQIHGIFECIPNDHLSGKNCAKCIGNKVKSTEKFITEAQEIHGDKYDYSLVDYINNHTPIKIICQHCGIYEQMPFVHLKGSNCSFCAGRKRKTVEQFIEEAKKIHGDKYDYSNIIYINDRTPVKICCPLHGIFEKAPGHHLRNEQGCQKCSKTNFSKKQISWLNDIAETNNIYIQHAMNEGEFRIGNYKVDGFHKESKTVYEFYGCYFHGCFQCYKGNQMNELIGRLMNELFEQTKKRESDIIAAGYQIVSIWEHDWNFITKNSLPKNIKLKLKSKPIITLKPKFKIAVKLKLKFKPKPIIRLKPKPRPIIKFKPKPIIRLKLNQDLL